MTTVVLFSGCYKVVVRAVLMVNWWSNWWLLNVGSGFLRTWRLNSEGVAEWW